MILPQTYIQSLALLVVSLLLLGSWPALVKKNPLRRFELFGLDFALGAFLAALLFAFTAGSMGFDGFSFADDLMHARKLQWVVGFAAGGIFNFGVMLFLGALSVAGVALSSTVAFGLSVVLGVGLPQLIRRAYNPLFLFLAFTLILTAIVCATLIHSAEMEERAQALLRQAQAAKKKLTHVPGAVKGMLLSLSAGLLFSLYFPLAARSREGEIGLGPYSCIFLVTLGIFFSAPLLFTFFINLPVEGEPLGIGTYFKGSLTSHFPGIAAGLMWCTGTLIPLVVASSEPAAQVPREISFPITVAMPLVSALWGFGVLREMPSSSRMRTVAILIILLLAAGVALVALAPAAVKAA